MKTQTLTCPLCLRGNLLISQDCLREFKARRGRYNWQSSHKPKLHTLPRAVMHCTHCEETSETSTVLENVFMRHEKSEYLFMHLSTITRDRIVVNALPVHGESGDAIMSDYEHTKLRLFADHKTFYTIRGVKA